MNPFWHRLRRPARLIGLVCLIALAPIALAADPPTPAPAPVKPPASLKEVIVVFKTHFDIGFTDLASAIVDKYRTTMIDKALDTCEKSNDLPPEQRFAWMVPGWPLHQILWPGQSPERRERLLKALRDGRIIFHAWPCTMQTESADPEDLVRGMIFSSGLARQLGQPLPRDAKMTDVPEHTWLLPTVMKRAGIDFLHLGCNGGSAPPVVPTLYWWEGPDGSRLLTFYSTNYGSELMPPADWPYRTWLCMKMTGDNHGPPTAEEVKKLFAEAEKTMPGVKVRVGRLSDFYDAIMKENPKNIPVVRADMPDTWIHGSMAMPVETKLARMLRPRIEALEALDTQMNAWGLVTMPVAATVQNAYENSVMYSEHTWGMDCKKFGSRYGAEWSKALEEGKYEKLLKSFDEHRAYARNLGAPLHNELAARLTSLAKSVDVAGRRVVVYNPFPWRCASATVSAGWSVAPVACLKDAATGEKIAADCANRVITFTARDVPPMGYRTYLPVDDSIEVGGGLAIDQAAGTLENRYYRIKLALGRGGIASIADKRTGRELVDPASPHGFGQYLHERFDADNVHAYLEAYNRKGPDGKLPGWVNGDFGKPGLPPASQQPYAADGAVAGSVKFERRGQSVSATLQCPAAGSIVDATELKVSLGQDQPYLELEWRIKSKQGDPSPEGGWLCLPVKAARPKFTLARPGSLVDPARDLIPGANHHLFSLAGGLTVTGEDGAGVGICPIDSPLVSLDTPGLWKYDREWTPKKPEVFVNLYNNMWNTNFPLWIDGTWTSRVRVWSVEPGQSAEQALITPAAEARQPLLAVAAESRGGILPPVRSGLAVSRPGVMVTAFGPNPDGQGTILRLWEMAGEGGPLKVTLPQGFKAARAQPVSLRGQAIGEPLKVENSAVEVTVEKFAPLTLLF